MFVRRKRSATLCRPRSMRSRDGQRRKAHGWICVKTRLAIRERKTHQEWVEAVTLLPAQSTGDMTSKSVFRIRVAQPSTNYQVLFFRLFFDDKPGQQPELIAWDESGTHVLRSGALGSELICRARIR